VSTGRKGRGPIKEYPMIESIDPQRARTLGSTCLLSQSRPVIGADIA